MTVAGVIPTAIHRGEDALPFAPIAPGVETKVAQVDVGEGLWVVRSRMQPGYRAQTHRHTGPVLGFTLSGAWHYLESADDVNRAGSYLFEPAGSVHTLHVPDDAPEPADVWFAIWGANLNLDADGNVETVTDATAMLAAYRRSCSKHGLGDPPVIVA